MSRVTLSRYLIEQTRSHNTPADLRFLIEVVARACKEISHAVSKGALGGVLGSMGTENVQGEVQKKLDVMSNEILLEANEWAGNLAGMASEEMDHPTRFRALPERRLPAGLRPAGRLQQHRRQRLGRHHLLGAALPQRVPEPERYPARGGLPPAGHHPGRRRLRHLRPADHADADPRQRRQGLHPDRELGSFVLTHDNISVPESTAEFAINMSNQRHWEAPVKRYVEELLAGKEGPLGKNYNMRWIASMVADVHRILTRGGVFMYPRDAREPEKPGKLRLMYEANPMSFIIEQAGGAATNGTQRILDIKPENLHQRVAVFLGSKQEVERITGYHAE